MTAEPAENDTDTAHCRVCRSDVPAGIFCGVCGAPLCPRRGDGPAWLRLRSYAAAAGERLLRPAPASSLFPQLPTPARTPFRVGLALLPLALMIGALLRAPALLIAAGTLGLPLLFVLYLYDSGAGRDVPDRILLVTTGLAVVLGIAWALLTGPSLARAYSVPLGDSVTVYQIFRHGLGVPIGALILAVVPVVVARLLDRTPRESLHGFMIGTLGTLSFTAAATAPRLVPQFTTELVVRNRPMPGLLAQAAIHGMTLPLSAAAVGGLVGAALWFTQPDGVARRHPGSVRVAMAAAAATVIMVYAVLGLVDVARVPEPVQLAVHVAVTVAALYALRIGLHLALLHEAHDPVATGRSVCCPHCGTVTPDLAFCPACGAAARASSRSSRTLRREQRPGRTHSMVTLPAAWGGVIAVTAVALTAVGGVLSRPPVRYACPPECGSPPVGEPVTAGPLFTAADGRFSVSYPAAGAAYRVTTRPDGVTAESLHGDGGTMRLFARQAIGSSPVAIANSVLAQSFPNARTAYEIPNAMVGYQSGYGLVADYWPLGAMSSVVHMRVIVMVAVKDDLALIADAVGPYRESRPGPGSTKPSGVGLELAKDLGRYVNTFRWAGDPAR
ncbi:zinc ribbon domain-containing protein [Mycobacterium sp. TNTM28]|uniref:Zinc ribbon domain-containing protein n=1 Tax=[Mycobacterium] fortunisiensis TaxID=2600579 RepID=A0ABS6KN04_9MYCO|nr:zinc ribbon domain-containing protein [[Mycobacterium] fortunisiensis]MBU9764942.1 zinc ribbon domain-containing protein [[Mycobacterium] fortunisiensis]